MRGAIDVVEYMSKVAVFRLGAIIWNERKARKVGMPAYQQFQM